MYEVYYAGQMLHNLQFKEDGYVLSEKRITYELNEPDTFQFTIPADHPKIDIVEQLRGEIVVYKGSEELFRGVVVDTTKGFNNSKKVYCEGMLYYLKKTIQRPFEYTGDIPEFAEYLLKTHNNMVEAKKQFKLGTVTITDSNNYINRSATTYPDTLDCFIGKIIDTHGGYIRARVGADGTRYIDLLEDYGNYNEQIIEFGVNLLSLEEYIDASEVYTALIPLGETLDEDTNEKLLISSVNNGVDYVYSQEAVDLFGWIWATEEWPDVTIADNLLRKAKETLEASIEKAVSITLSAVDLNLTDVNIERIKLGDWVRVVSLPHKLDKYFLVSKMKLDLDSPKNSELTLGVSFSSLTDQQVQQQKNVAAAVTAVTNVDYAVSIAMSASNKANEAENKATNAESKADDAKTVVSNIEQDYVNETTFNLLKTRVDNLELENAALEQRVAALEVKVDILEAEAGGGL